jgi:hypothetical protein
VGQYSFVECLQYCKSGYGRKCISFEYNSEYLIVLKMISKIVVNYLYQTVKYRIAILECHGSYITSQSLFKLSPA